LLGIEELMPRIVPNASSIGMTAGHLLGHDSHAVISDTSTGSDASSHSLAGDTCAGGATLAATLTNASGATGQASFNATTGSLKVQVHGAAASTALNVVVNGTTVGTLTTDASGNGHAKLSNITAQAGSTITVGDLTATFAQVKFTATLSGATGVTGSADFNSLENKLQVSITGATANTTYNVTVDNVVVGQLTTNSSGAGRLKLSPANLTLLAGSTITVSDTLGNPAILQGTFA